MRCRFRNSTHVFAVLLAGLLHQCYALLYKPDRGLIWDPSCLVWKGRHYCFFMYKYPANTTFGGYHYGSLATSDDGAHFEDRGIIDAEVASGRMVWDKCQVMITVNATTGKPLWVLNHGSSRGPYQDCPSTSQCMRFMVSEDASLVHWRHLYTQTTDPEYYKTGGRWDDMYMLQTAPSSFVGFTTATPLSGPAPGMASSSDGVHYSPAPAMKIEWGHITPRSMELGGAAKIGDSYFVLVGMMGEGDNKGYSIYSFRSDSVNGTYRPDPRAWRLSGTTDPAGAPGLTPFTQALADFSLNYDTGEALITNYMAMPNTDPTKRSLGGGGDVWLQPLKRPVIDASGSLHLGWWPGNNALRGSPIPLTSSALLVNTSGGALPTVLWLDPSAAGSSFDHRTGVVLMGAFTVSPASHGATGVGFALGDPETPTVILMDAVKSGGHTVVGDLQHEGQNTTSGFLVRDISGSFVCGANGALCDDATLVRAAPGQRHSFVLLVRRGMFELYVNELLVQTLTYGSYPVAAGGIGVAVNGTQGGSASFESVTAATWSSM